MLEFLNCIFLKLTHAFFKCHQKTQNDEQIYMEMKNMKHEETMGYHAMLCQMHLECLPTRLI